MGVTEHKASAARTVTVGVLTMSSTRTIDEDESGRWIVRAAGELGHRVVDHRVVGDRAEEIAAAVMEVIETRGPRALLLNGGTGIGPTDVTIETVGPLFEKEMTAFGSLFARLSHDQIGSAAILSRAAAGTIGGTAIFCMPGSLKACRLACEALIFPELGHIARHLGEGENPE